MTFCADYKNVTVKHALVAILLTAIVGCNSVSSKPLGVSQKMTPTAVNGAGPDIDLNCVSNHIRNPAESFHYSFSDQSSNPWKESADVTPQSIDGIFMNNSLPAPQPFHGTPQEVSTNLMAIGRMSSLFAVVHGTPAVINEGADKGINGYDTVRFSIDTARATATEQGLFLDVFGKGGSEKGIVWVTAQGCPVKLVLDEELHGKDGSLLGKAHYEEAMVMK